MIYGFETDSLAEASAALIVYSIYRSRDQSRFKPNVKMWGQIERFIKSSAKRSKRLPSFIERLKPKLCCDSISPRWCEAGVKNDIGLISRVNSAGDTEYIQPAGAAGREFLITALNKTDGDEVVKVLFSESAWVVLLVRERIEREKPAEKYIKKEEVGNEN